MTYLRKLILCSAVVTSHLAAASDSLLEGIPLPTGQRITPTAAHGSVLQDLNPGHAAAPDIRASHASALAVSPDGRMLAITTSGFNLHFGKDGNPVPELSTEYVFVFDITGTQPKQVQALSVPNAYQGLAWSPSSDAIFASGGKDDTVLEFVQSGSAFAPGRTFHLGHKAGLGLNTTPMAGALAVSPDGTRLLAANFEHDSLSLIDLKSGQLVTEQDLRPGIIDPKHRGEPGGSFPRCLIWVSPNRAYVGSERDREIVSLAVNGAKIRVTKRMPVHGQPIALIANHKGTRLYVAVDNTDQVAIFDTAHDSLIEEFNVVAPQAIYPNSKKLGGANSDALALTPGEDTLLVSNGGENAVAVVRLSARAQGVTDQRKKDDDDGDARNDRS